MTDDPSNGYESHARAFMSARGASGVGAETVRGWARSLSPGAKVLDLGCGHGVPISQALQEEGLIVYGVDASPTLINAFRERFPALPARCEPVQTSGLFDRKFDGVVAWGLMFLLPTESQLALIRRVALALNPGGRFLFTAPWQVCEWDDLLTGHRSISPGIDAYEQAFAEAGLALVDRYVDEGENHYFDVARW